MSRPAALLLACAALALAGCEIGGVTVFQSLGGAINLFLNLVTLGLLGVVVYQYRLLRKPVPIGVEAIVDEAFRNDLRQSRKCLTVTDHGGRVLWQDRGVRFPLAWTLADIIGRDLRERIPEGPEGDVQRAAYELALGGQQPAPYTALMRDAHGNTAWLEVEHTPRADGGTVIRYRDCTAERMQAEHTARERDAERERADRAERAAAAAGRAQVAASRLPDPSWTT